MEQTDQYLSLLSEIIAKQSVILGPTIAVIKARSIPGLTVNDDGKVTDYKGNPEQIIQQLVDVYVDLSGQIIKNALGSVFAKYPHLDQK